MNYILLRFTVALLTFAVSVFILQVVDKRNAEEPIGIAPIDITAARCAEPQTTNDFIQFWQQFRSAVELNDKAQLFSMKRVCGFYRDVLNKNEELQTPLPSALDTAPFGIQPRTSKSGTSFLLETENDLLANYKIIFSDRVRRRILGETPVESAGGRYQIRWRDDGAHTLLFERLDSKGYKYAGLEWEP